MIEKPKKERKFLKLLGKVGEILVQELLLKVGRSLVQKIGGKKTLPSIIFLALFCNIAFASIDSIPYPITGNKQRLGWQTTGNGLVYRGRASDTITKPSNYANKDIKAYMLVDTVNNVMYSYIASKGGWKFNNSDTVIIQGATMPFDSITFNTAKDGTVGVGEVEYNDTQGSLIQGLKGGNVTNVIGQQLHQRVNNRTGATLSKGTAVYLSGSQGNRITAAKALATSDPTSANTFGIVAESIADNASGYVITEGLITGINTSGLTEDSAVYLSPTVAGGLTSTKPQAPNHGVYIGVCVKTNAGSGELFVKIKNGLELDELHDVLITSPASNATLYYKSSEGIWRDTTAALLVSDTASMLTPYFRDADTTSLNLVSRFATKLNISDTSAMLTNYLRSGVAASTYLPLTGGTTTGLITSSFSNTNNYSTSAEDNNSFTIYNNTQSTNNIYGGLKFLIGENSGAIPGGPGLAQIYGIRAGGTSNPSTDLTFSTKSNVSGVLEKMRIKFDGKVGIGTSTPSYLLDVNGQIGSTGFIKSGGTSSQFLKADGSVDANTYLTTGTASSTYLPLTGGTLTGALNGTTGTFTGLNIVNPTTEAIFTLQGYDNNTPTRIQFKTTGNVRREIVLPTSDSNLEFRTSTIGGTQGGYSFYTRRNPNAEQLAFNIDYNKDIQMYGALSVSSTTTLTGALTVNNATVLNEGSGDFDTRIESDGNANMVFVDASTDRIGIGTATPSKTLDVNGEVKIATVTATPTALLGKDASNVVGEVTTVAQTGLMTRSSTTATTGTPSAVFTVTHGLGSNPTAVIVTGAGAVGAQKLIFEVYAKNSTTFSVQVWNYDGTEAAGISVTIYWLAIK